MREFFVMQQNTFSMLHALFNGACLFPFFVIRNTNRSRCNEKLSFFSPPRLPHPTVFVDVVLIVVVAGATRIYRSKKKHESLVCYCCFLFFLWCRLFSFSPPPLSHPSPLARKLTKFILFVVLPTQFKDIWTHTIVHFHSCTLIFIWFSHPVMPFCTPQIMPRCNTQNILK